VAAGAWKDAHMLGTSDYTVPESPPLTWHKEGTAGVGSAHQAVFSEWRG